MDGGDWGNLIGAVLVLSVLVWAALDGGSDGSTPA